MTRKQHRKSPLFTEEGWKVYRHFMFWFYVLTFSFLNGILAGFDSIDGTHRAFSVWTAMAVFILLRVALFWDEIKEKL